MQSKRSDWVIFNICYSGAIQSHEGEGLNMQTWLKDIALYSLVEIPLHFIRAEKKTNFFRKSSLSI